MWGRRGITACARLCATAALLSLAGCASHRVAHAPQPAASAPVAGRDARGAYRFEMTQHGHRMSADEFDAWMKARGIRVAKGAPSKPAPGVQATAKAKPKAKAQPKATPARAVTTREPAPKPAKRGEG